MWIDSHAHLSYYKFDTNKQKKTFRYLDYDPQSGDYAVRESDREALIEALRAAGVGAVVEPAIDLDSNARVLDLAAAHPGWLYPAVGLHPTRVAGLKSPGGKSADPEEARKQEQRSIKALWARRRELEALSKRPEVVAIGETGLDFHYPRPQQHRRAQYRWFIWQILLAHRRRLPLILHVRNANKEALWVLRLMRPFLHGGVAHCFSGDWAQAQTYLRLGFHLGIGGTLLQDGRAGARLREVVRLAPLDRLLLETDAPFVPPTCDALPSKKMREKVCNTPLILPAVAAGIAALKGVEIAEVERQTTLNASALLKLDP